MTEEEFQEYMRQLKAARVAALKILGQDASHIIRPEVVCNDGWHASIQASSFHCSTPREDNRERYTHWEIGFPSYVDEELAKYGDAYDDPGDTDSPSVFSYVPTALIMHLVKRHGGVAGWSERL